MNPCIIAYIPRPGRGNPEVFLENLRVNWPTTPTILFSEVEWPEWEGIKKMNADPEEVIRGAQESQRSGYGKRNPMALKNVPFFCALKLAIKGGYSHFMFLETDCRVRHNRVITDDTWDQQVLREFERKQQRSKVPLIGAGTIVIYNPSNGGAAGYLRFQRLMGNCADHCRIMAIYGGKGAEDKSGSCIFPNGALGVYSVEQLTLLFPEIGEHGGEVKLSHQCTAWDMEIGKRVWQKHADKAYDHLAQLWSIYSGYGNVLTTEEERLKMLTDGTVVAVHQVKSKATV